MTHCNSEAIATNDINYSCCVKVVELGSPIIWIHITPLVINSLGADIQEHANFPDKRLFKATTSNFKVRLAHVWFNITLIYNSQTQ